MAIGAIGQALAPDFGTLLRVQQDFAGYRTFGSLLEGHPTPALPWVDVAGGG